MERAIAGVLPWLVAALREAVGPRLQEWVRRQTAGLDLTAFECQEYYDHLDRVISAAEVRGPPYVGHVLGLVRTLPAVPGYALARAALTPVLLVIVLVGWAPAMGTPATMGAAIEIEPAGQG